MSANGAGWGRGWPGDGVTTGCCDSADVGVETGPTPEDDRGACSIIIMERGGRSDIEARSCSDAWGWKAARRKL
jgi:hypothetical protein